MFRHIIVLGQVLGTKTSLYQLKKMVLLDIRFYCNIQFNYGKTIPFAVSNQLYFLSLVPSSPPQKVQCTPMSSSSLLINWSPPPVSEINGVLKEYRVFYRPLREWEGKLIWLWRSWPHCSGLKLIKPYNSNL